jgi:glucosamine--fructose-6-phosphate aminotransferase (isomerizing)
LGARDPRAALSSRTLVITMRIMDETAATVNALAKQLREQNIVLHLCGGPHG